MLVKAQLLIYFYLQNSQACNEANFPTRSPPDWWMDELSILNVAFFKKVLSSMKLRSAKLKTIVSVLITYTEKSLRELVRDHTGNGTTYMDHGDAEVRKQQKHILESIVALLPPDKAAFPIHFLCCLLRAAIFLNATLNCKNELEKRVSVVLEHVTVGDLLVLSFTYDGERLFDLDSVKRIISGFVGRERSAGVFNGGDFNDKGSWSVAMQKVLKITDAYLGEIATDADLSISKFTGIANLVPKGARKVDDDLYRAVDIFLKVRIHDLFLVLTSCFIGCKLEKSYPLLTSTLILRLLLISILIFVLAMVNFWFAPNYDFLKY